MEVIEGLKYKPLWNRDIIYKSEYRSFLPIIEDGDILLLASNSLISKIIGKLTYSPYKWSHVAILYKKEDLILRVESTVPRPGIYAFNPYKLPKTWAILRFKNGLNVEQRKELIRNAILRVFSIKYAVRGLVGWLTGRHPAKNSEVCSQFVYNTYKMTGIELLRDSQDRVSPQDLWETPLLEVVKTSWNINSLSIKNKKEEDK